MCSEPYSNICLSFFNEKSKSRYDLCIKNIQYNILFRGSRSEPIFKNVFNQWLIWIFEYLNKITLKYYLYLYLCLFRITNQFGYSFSKYGALENIQIFVPYIMWPLNIFIYLFVSILWCSLITEPAYKSLQACPSISVSKLCNFHLTYLVNFVKN